MLIPKLQPVTFLRRYKRFLADVQLADNTTITVHCPNTGSMLGCMVSGCEALISRSDNPKRKYPHTLEMLKPGKSWIGINTSRTNALVREALENDIIAEIGSIDEIRPEVRTSHGTRLDFMVRQGNRKTYIEVKNCTLAENGIAMFPDAVTARGTKHLKELISLCEQGHKAVVFFCVQRSDADSFMPAVQIDPEYSHTLEQAVAKGVQVLAYQAKVEPQEIIIYRSLPVVPPPWGMP